MNIKDSSEGTIGFVSATLFHEDGTSEQVEGSNLVMTLGKALIASRMIGTASAVVGYMGIGSGTTTPAVGQTTLVSETARVAVTATANANVVTYVATFGPGVGTGSINESGLFNASTSGTMFARSTSVVLTKGASDTLALTWTVTFN